MKKNKILITWRDIIDEIEKFKYIFKKNNILYDLIKPKQKLEENILTKIIHKYDGVICGDDEFTKKVINLAKNLKVISKWGTGLDSIDKDYAESKGIKVFNVKDAFTYEVASYAFGIILLLSRDLYKCHASLQKFIWEKYRGVSLFKKTLGVVGFGRIGEQLTNFAKAFKMEILVCDINSKRRSHAKNRNFKCVSFKKILNYSDVIAFCPDLNKSSKFMFNKNIIKYIKKKPIIVNISRGNVVDEKAMIYCLKKKIVSKFGTDVFNEEPVKHKNLLLNEIGNFYSAHNAYNTHESVSKTNKRVVENLLKVLKKK